MGNINNKELEDKIRNLDDKGLLEILKHRSDYTDETIVIVEDECKKRKIDEESKIRSLDNKNLLTIISQRGNYTDEVINIAEFEYKKRNLNLEDEIKKLNNSELTNILKRRDDYIEKVVNIAEQECKERNIIPINELGETLKEDIPPLPEMWLGYIFAIGFFMAELIEVFIYKNNLGDIAIAAGLGGMVYWLYCIYRFHIVLGRLSPTLYPITPFSAVFGHFIPFYNLYWIFKWPIVLSGFINKGGITRMSSGGWIGFVLLSALIIGRSIDGGLGLLLIFGTGTYIKNILERQTGINRHLAKRKWVIICTMVAFLILVAVTVAIYYINLISSNQIVKAVKEIPARKEYQTDKAKISLPSDKWRFLDANKAREILGEVAKDADLSLATTDGNSYALIYLEDITGFKIDLEEIRQYFKSNYLNGLDIVEENISGDTVFLKAYFEIDTISYYKIIIYKTTGTIGITYNFWGMRESLKDMKQDIDFIVNNLIEISLKQRLNKISPNELFKKYSDAVVLVRVYDKDGAITAFGSGINIIKEGAIITNLHVILAGKYIDVKFLNHGIYEDVYIAGLSKNTRDLVILKINGKDLPSIDKERSVETEIGDKVIVISNPKGMLNSLSEGIVSGIRYDENNNILYQITAPISAGSSGGAVFNEYGELLGVCSSTIESGQNLNFYIPIEEINNFEIYEAEDMFTLDQLVDYLESKEQQEQQSGQQQEQRLEQKEQNQQMQKSKPDQYNIPVDTSKYKTESKSVSKNVQEQTKQSISVSDSTYEYEFARDFIKGLECRVIADEKIKSASTDPKQYSSEYDMVRTFMKNARLASNKYEMAKNYLKEYLNSSTKLVKETSDAAIGLYDGLIQVNNDEIKMYEELYSPQNMQNPQNFNIGNFISRQSELEAKSEEYQRMFVDCSIMLTYCLVSNVPDENGKMSYLAITSDERKELVTELENIFGGNIKGGLKAGQSYLDASGAAIYKVLNNYDFKTADERKTQ